MSPYFILLPVVFPIIGGFILLIWHPKDDKTRNIYAEGVVFVTSVLVWICLFGIRREPVEIYSFFRGFSIDFYVDGLGSLFAGMISVMWPFVMLYAFAYMEHTKRKNLFFAFYVMTYGVTLGAAFAGNLTTLYVFYEMLSLVTLPLVSYYHDHESMFAGRRYAAYTIGGASLAFFPVIVATMFGDAGVFTYGGNLASVADERMLAAAFLFGFFGFGVKSAIFPFHAWLPLASVAPTPVTALLHAVAVVNTGVFSVMRLAWYIYGPDLLLGSWVQAVCILTAAFSLVFAAAMALKERHFKRRLAYSTMSNLSYMMFGIMLMTPHGFRAGMMHMLFHGIIKMSLFLCAGAFMHVTGKNYIYEINGAGRHMPVTFGVYTLGALSLTGIPLFCGFVSKWNLIMAGLEAGRRTGLIGVACLIMAAFLCAMYTITVSIRAFFPVTGSDRFDANAGRADAPALMLIPIVVFGIANVAFGLFPGPVIGFLGQIASGLF